MGVSSVGGFSAPVHRGGMPGSCGSPSTCSATVFSWISLVPAPMVEARVRRKPASQRDRCTACGADLPSSPAGPSRSTAISWMSCSNAVMSSRETEDVAPAPAFLSDHKPDVERKTLLETILETFARRLGELERPEDVGPLWEDRAALAGTRYRILIDGESEPFDALARGLTSDGSLIATRDGHEQTISLADARIIRD